MAVALRAPHGLLVRAGVVGWRGRAILIPGRRGSGKSRLVAELARLGATVYSDGFAALDAEGRVVPYVHPQPRRADLLTASKSESVADCTPLPVTLVVSTTYRFEAPWRPEAVRGAQAVLPIIENAVLVDGEVAWALRIAALIAPTVLTLQGLRPDAATAAPRILELVDDLIDRCLPARGGMREAPSVRARAQAKLTDGREALAAANDLPGEDVPDPDERARLETRDFILLLHWHGRFGNRMHQYAYGATYTRLNGCEFWLPSDWEGRRLFKTQHHKLLPDRGLRARLGQTTPPFNDLQYRLTEAQRLFPKLSLIQPHHPRENYRKRKRPLCFDSICAYHPSVFSAMSRRHLRSVFEFSDEVKHLDIYKWLEDRQGTYDIAHLRRGDVSNAVYNQTHLQGYSVLSKTSYLAAFEKYGFDPAAIEWVSDDLTGRWHPDRAPSVRGGWRYPSGSEYLPGVIFDWLEDFLRLYFARTIFRANSSFSWWAAFLAPHARVFSPVVDKRHIYGVDGTEEIEVDFVEGNHPHWMSRVADIVIRD